MTLKICSQCNISKDISLFAVDSNTPSGVRSYCKSCHKKYQKHYTKSTGVILPKNNQLESKQARKLTTSEEKFKSTIIEFGSVICSAVIRHLENKSKSAKIASNKSKRGYKYCRNCGQPKPTSEFPMHNKSKDGYSKCCKDCLSKDRREFSVDKIPTKVCGKCNKSKFVFEFRRDKTRASGLSPYCRDCYKKGTQTNVVQRKLGRKEREVLAKMAFDVLP